MTLGGVTEADGGDLDEDEYQDFVTRIIASHQYQSLLEEDRQITEDVTRLVWERCRGIHSNYTSSLKRQIGDLQARLRDLHTSSMKQILALKSAMGGGEEAAKSVVQHLDPLKFVGQDEQELLLLVLQDQVQSLMQGTATAQQVERLEHYGEGLGSWKAWKAKYEDCEAREAALQRQFVETSEKLARVSKHYTHLRDQAGMLREDVAVAHGTKAETSQELARLREKLFVARSQMAVWKTRAERRKSALSDEELQRWKERQWHDAEDFKLQLLPKITRTVNEVGMVAEDYAAAYWRECEKLSSLKEESSVIMLKHLRSEEELNKMLRNLEEQAGKQSEVSLVQAELTQSRSEVRRLQERCARLQAVALASKLNPEEAFRRQGTGADDSSPSPKVGRRSSLPSVSDLHRLLSDPTAGEGVENGTQTDLDVAALEEMAAFLPEEVAVLREVLAEVQASLTKALGEFRRRRMEREAESIFAQVGLLDITGKDCFQRLYADAMARPDRQERMRATHRSACRQDMEARFTERGDLEKSLERLISRKRDARAELMLFKKAELSPESLPGLWIELGGLPVFRVLPLAPTGIPTAHAAQSSTTTAKEVSVKMQSGGSAHHNASVDSWGSSHQDFLMWDSPSMESLTFAKERHFPEVLLPQQIASLYSSDGPAVKLAPMSSTTRVAQPAATTLGQPEWLDATNHGATMKVPRPHESEVLAVSKELSKRVKSTMAGAATSPQRSARSPRRLLPSPRAAEQQCRLPRLTGTLEQTLPSPRALHQGL